MGSGIRPVGVAERRARLAARHHLAPRAGTVNWRGSGHHRAARHRPGVGLPVGLGPHRGRSRGHRARAVRRTHPDTDARDAADGVRGARCPGAGDPGGLYRPDRRADAAGPGPAGGGVRHRRGRGELAQGGGRGHGAGAGRPRQRHRRRARPGRAAAARPDRLRRGQELRRPGERHHQAAHAAVGRGPHRARPPARRVDLQPVHLDRRAGPAPAAGGRRPGRAGPPLAARVRPRPAGRPAVVDRLDGRAGQAGAGSAGDRRGRPGRHPGRHAGGRRGRAAGRRAVGGAAARPGPHRDGLARPGLVRRRARPRVVRPVREHRPHGLVGGPDRRRLGAPQGRRDRGPAARGRRGGGRGGHRRRGAAPARLDRGRPNGTRRP